MAELAMFIKLQKKKSNIVTDLYVLPVSRVGILSIGKCKHLYHPLSSSSLVKNRPYFSALLYIYNAPKGRIKAQC